MEEPDNDAAKVFDEVAALCDRLTHDFGENWRALSIGIAIEVMEDGLPLALSFSDPRPWVREKFWEEVCETAQGLRERERVEIEGPEDGDD